MRNCATCGQRFSGDATFCPFDGTKLVGGGTERSLVKPTDEIAPGVVIGENYRVDRVLGEGGMGIVFAVTHLKLNKKFALKLLKRELARDPETRARFLVEAQAAGQIHHPNVVEITDYSSLPDGSAYMVMEYLEGQPLARMIKLGGAIPAARAVTIIRDIANALQAAHEAGVVHRDLKPDNVFVLQRKDGGDQAKILDFGVAKVAGGARLTRTGMVFGTPHYMSPEQASGGVIDSRTDLYALGVIMYEMFTGRVPFEADTYMGVLTKHMFEAPVPPSQLGGSARELGALEDVTLKALAKRPEERYSTMLELVADIDRIVQIGENGRISVAPTVDGLRRPDFGAGTPEDKRRALAALNLADELEPPAKLEVMAARHDREKRVRSFGLGAIVVVLLCGVAVAAVAVLRGQQGKSESPAISATITPVSSPLGAQAPAKTNTNTNTTANATLVPVVATEPTPSATTTATATAAATATTAATTTKPTSTATAKPTSKPSIINDVDDPWGKK